MTKERYEYRINKKGCECFRFSNFEQAREKMDELSAKRPGIYTMQSRTCRANKYGVLETDGLGRPLWTCWH